MTKTSDIFPRKCLHNPFFTIANRDLPGVRDGKETAAALVYIDTAGCGIHELETDDVESKGNEG